MSGRRVDAYQRPELQFGSVEFNVTQEYCQKPPSPAHFIFAIDVSWSSVQNRMIHVACDGIRKALFGGGKPLPLGSKIAILTFDKHLHFYNLSPNATEPHMLIVSDVEDGFVPLNEGFLVDPTASK